MTTNEFNKLCDANHVHTSFNEIENILSIDCAPGQVMTGSGLHYRDIWLDDPKAPVSLREAYDDLANDLADGVERCDIQQCYFCEENF